MVKITWTEIAVSDLKDMLLLLCQESIDQYVFKTTDNKDFGRIYLF